MITTITVAGITPKWSGFGEYEVVPHIWQASDLSEAAQLFSGGITDTAIKLDSLDQEYDIRGKVHNEPPAVYAVPDGYDGYLYFGVWQ